MSGSAEIAARMIRMARELVEASDALVGNPGAGPTQLGMMNAAGRFAIAGAIHDLAIAVRESGRLAIVPPHPVSAAIPEPAVGQVWRAAMPGAQPRTIIGMQDGRIAYRWPNNRAGWDIWHKTWMSWAKRTGARPVVPDTTPTPTRAAPDGTGGGL